MNKIYEILVDFYSENVTSTNITKNAEDLNIWFNNNDINTSFLKALFVNQNEEPIDLTEYDVSVNWRLTNRDTIIQENNIEKIEDIGYVLFKVPSEVVNENKGKIYFNITLKKRDSNETLNSSSFVATLVDSLTDTSFSDNKLITNVKNAQMIDGRTVDEITTEMAKKVIEINTEGLASEEYVNEKVKDFVTEQDINNAVEGLASEQYVNEKTKDFIVESAVDEKIKGINVDLTNYLTVEEGDKKYMPANMIIDNKKPAYGEYKTLLKGDMFNKYHDIYDFWTCNQNSNHDTRRPIKYIKKIPSTDLFIAYIDNNSSGVEKGFSIFHFLTDKAIEEDNYITISSLGLGIQDNTNYVRFFFSETKPLIFVTYFTSTKETHSAMLSVNTTDKTINVDDDIIVRNSSDNLWIYDGDRVFNTYGVNISDDFERIAMVFNKNDTSATNLVIMDIALNDEGKYKFGNKKECVNYVQCGTDYNQYGYLLSNICFIDKNTFTIGCYNNSTAFVYSIDDANDAISSVRSLISNGLAICGIVKVGDYLFCYGYGSSYNYKQAIEVLKYNADNTLTYVTSLACDNNYKARDYNLSKYCPDCMNMGSPYGPGFWISNYYVQDNKIMIMTTCPAGINEVYVGTACFNTLTEQFDYYYPNFSWVKRQLTGITFIDNEKTKAVGYLNNRMYLFEVAKDEPFVVQCGNNILYSYINNLVEETAQLTMEN